MADTGELAALLGKHQQFEWHVRNGRWVSECECGDELPHLEPEWEDEWDAFAAHVAEVIAAAGWRKEEPSDA